MPSKVYSAAVVGVEAFEVEIEVHAGWGNTDKIAVVGLPDTAVKESKDRVTSAISNSSLRCEGSLIDCLGSQAAAPADSHRSCGQCGGSGRGGGRRGVRGKFAFGGGAFPARRYLPPTGPLDQQLVRDRIRRTGTRFRRCCQSQGQQ
jgi:hypothetical protein